MCIVGNPDLDEEHCGYIQSPGELADYDCEETGDYICERNCEYVMNKIGFNSVVNHSHKVFG